MEMPAEEAPRAARAVAAMLAAMLAASTRAAMLPKELGLAPGR